MDNKSKEKRKRQILRRARQHNLFTPQKNTYHFSDLSPELVKAISQSTTEENDPILVFLDTARHWTVLGSTFIYSTYENILVKARLSGIQGKVTMILPESIKERSHNSFKQDLRFLFLDHEKVRIWAPPGSEYFGLVNILQNIR
ncbi:hypothetical protein Lepto7376_2346 [[Leptolyngbya] sp. PCC 7376]|nr:hypothetical protein Lepto7376_2346 [[Leptolyngbya] sp. PCC 7376]